LSIRGPISRAFTGTMRLPHLTHPPAVAENTDPFPSRS
jgi:hypothetical protein